MCNDMQSVKITSVVELKIFVCVTTKTKPIHVTSQCSLMTTSYLISFS